MREMLEIGAPSWDLEEHQLESVEVLQGGLAIPIQMGRIPPTGRPCYSKAIFMCPSATYCANLPQGKTEAQ